MKTIQAFKARDDKVFENEHDCQQHEAELDFDDWYAANELLGSCEGSRVNLRDLKEWLRDNRDKVAGFLGLASV